MAGSWGPNHCFVLFFFMVGLHGKWFLQAALENHWKTSTEVAFASLWINVAAQEIYKMVQQQLKPPNYILILNKHFWKISTILFPALPITDMCANTVNSRNQNTVTSWGVRLSFPGPSQKKQNKPSRCSQCSSRLHSPTCGRFNADIMKYLYRGNKRHRKKAPCSFPDGEINPVDLPNVQFGMPASVNFSNSYLSAIQKPSQWFSDGIRSLGGTADGCQEVILNAVTMAKFCAVLWNENRVNQVNQGTDNVHVCVKCKPSLV